MVFYEIESQHRDNTSWETEFDKTLDQHQPYITTVDAVLFVFLTLTNLVMLIGMYKTNKRFSLHKKLFFWDCYLWIS